MSILGIEENRTENWQTVKHFFGLSDDAKAKAKLVRRLDPKNAEVEEIRMELFWCGMRDFAFFSEVDLDDKIVETYEYLFGDLREQVARRDYTRALNLNEDRNYKVPTNEKDRSRLVSNVKKTEVDIVLDTPSRVFIGEAKYESDLGKNGSLVLVHQLIRQYVAVSILVHLAGCEKRVVPFVVTTECNRESMKKKAQVEFMSAKEKGVVRGAAPLRPWFCKCNVLTWSDINHIRVGS